MSIITGETSVDWMAPSVKLNHSGPATAALDQNVMFTTTVRNEGRLESQWVEITVPIPNGMEFVSSNPVEQPRNGLVVFPFGAWARVKATPRRRRSAPSLPGPSRAWP